MTDLPAYEFTHCHTEGFGVLMQNMPVLVLSAAHLPDHLRVLDPACRLTLRTARPEAAQQLYDLLEQEGYMPMRWEDEIATDLLGMDISYVLLRLLRERQFLPAPQALLVETLASIRAIFGLDYHWGSNTLSPAVRDLLSTLAGSRTEDGQDFLPEELRSAVETAAQAIRNDLQPPRAERARARAVLQSSSA
jgi:hypothetical protein